jgi:hypothetical protein
MFFEENRILHITAMFTPLLNLSNDQDGESDMGIDICPQQVTGEYPGCSKLGPDDTRQYTRIQHLHSQCHKNHRPH